MNGLLERLHDFDWSQSPCDSTWTGEKNPKLPQNSTDCPVDSQPSTACDWSRRGVILVDAPVEQGEIMNRARIIPGPGVSPSWILLKQIFNICSRQMDPNGAAIARQERFKIA
jgi:hypothetical protein